ncbi:MAG TPA: DUF4785 family protein [Xanthomonadaceae bacterium]|nr:DUF4785 family protein [Xanthomonadaceae bacterium]HRX98485.1 DUF4785 family protein [Xanthomonadaceae bacterium]
MNLSKLLAAALAATLAPVGAHAARDAQADAQAVAGDLAPTALVSNAGKTLRDNPDQQPVSFSWAIEADTKLTPAKPFVSDSREFWTNVDALDLAKGFRFQTTAPGAVIRISPTTSVGSKAAIAPGDISLAIDGRQLPATALTRTATSAQLKAAGLDFAEGTLAFRIDPAEGSGRVALTAKLAAGDYLIHVTEPESATVAKLSAISDTAFTGGDQEARLQLFDGANALPIKRMNGILTAPDGRAFDVDFHTDGKGQALADFALPAKASDVPGLWELHAFVAAEQNGELVMRDVKSAFAVVAPIGRLGSSMQMHDSAQALSFDVPVKAAMGSRFEVRAVLYGTDVDGKQVPLAIGHAADWIDAGNGSVKLSFDHGLLKGANAPFELRQVELYDQSRLAKQEARWNGLPLAGQLDKPRRGTLAD